MSRIEKTFKRIAWALPFIFIDVAIATHGFRSFSVEIRPLPIDITWQGALLTINITIAVFAVNFSLLAYQSSPYRALFRNLSFRHIASAAITLLLSLLPLFAFAFSIKWVPSIALLEIPLVAYASILLSQMAQEEVSPNRILEIEASDISIKSFGDDFAKSVEAARVEPPELQGEDKIPPPMHEMTWNPIPKIPSKDPFGFLRMLAITAIEHGDLQTFEIAIERVLTATIKLKQYIDEKRKKENLHCFDIINEYAISNFLSITHICKKEDRQVFAERFLNITAAYIYRLDDSKYESQEYAMHILHAMAEVAKELLGKGNSKVAQIPIIVARQWVTRSLKGSTEGPDARDFLKPYSLANCTNIIKKLGEEAITLGDTEFLYRCLDALGWLGCSTARSNESVVGKACASALVQLGRISRAKGLQCFWTHCALSPTDHALERLNWIVSWTVSQKEQNRNSWADFLSEAISRLQGKETKIRYVEQENKWKCEIINSDVPHIVTINDNGRVCSIDYSDINELKEYELY